MPIGENEVFKEEKEKNNMADHRRTRVTFYVNVPGQKRRKKVSFLAE
jgi:hypothetical protein